VTYPHWEPISHPRYKYRLAAAHRHTFTTQYPGIPGIVHVEAGGERWGSLYPDGVLMIQRGYAWDGASGPAVDTMDFTRGSLVHDVLLQLIAHGKLPEKPWKRFADAELYRIIREDGMSWYRAWWVWAAVRAFGGYGPYRV